MNYDVFSGEFPRLEGTMVRLRPLEPSDLEELHQLLQDPAVVKEYWANQSAPTYQETRAIYSVNPRLNYAKKKSITWAVALQESDRIVGLRDLFVDDDYKHVTVQGFIQEDYRREGISKEAYGLILNFAREKDVVGLLANTNAENIAAAALLCSVGFTTDYFCHKAEELRLVLSHDLELCAPPLFWTRKKKQFTVFAKSTCRVSRLHSSPMVSCNVMKDAGPVTA